MVQAFGGNGCDLDEVVASEEGNPHHSRIRVVGLQLLFWRYRQSCGLESVLEGIARTMAPLLWRLSHPLEAERARR